MCSVGGMTLTEEDLSIRRKTGSSVTFFTTNRTKTGPGNDPGLGGDRPANNRLNTRNKYMTDFLIS